MHMKWILLLFPVSLVMMVTPVFCQSTLLTNAVADSEYHQSNLVGFQSDTSRIAIPADSTLADLQVGWNKQPGQMPVYFPGILPNSMPVLSPPAVDEEMIIPISKVQTDHLQTQNTGKKLKEGEN